jgi:hypothetical protein
VRSQAGLDVAAHLFVRAGLQTHLPALAAVVINALAQILQLHQRFQVRHFRHQYHQRHNQLLVPQLLIPRLLVPRQFRRQYLLSMIVTAEL